MPVQPVDEFFNTDEFATAVTYTPFGGSPVSINVIFDREGAYSQLIDGIVVENVQPVALCRSSDVPNVKARDTLVIGGTTYKVASVQPTATGVTTLLLTRDL